MYINLVSVIHPLIRIVYNKIISFSACVRVGWVHYSWMIVLLGCQWWYDLRPCLFDTFVYTSIQLCIPIYPVCAPCNLVYPYINCDHTISNVCIHVYQ